MTTAAKKPTGPKPTDHDLTPLAQEMGLGVRIFFSEAMWKACTPDVARLEFVDLDDARERRARAVLLMIRRVIHEHAQDYAVVTFKSEGKERKLLAQMGYDLTGFWVRVMPEWHGFDEGAFDL